MTPTLIGRIQTRLILLSSIGVVWTALIVPALPRGKMEDLVAVYRVAFLALLATAVIGSLCWEPLYHLIQQWRWEKDWPILYGLLQGFPEGIIVYLVVDSQYGPVPITMFAILFATTWLLVWLFANGPMRVMSLRWRYQGGRVL